MPYSLRDLDSNLQWDQVTTIKMLVNNRVLLDGVSIKNRLTRTLIANQLNLSKQTFLKKKRKLR